MLRLHTPQVRDLIPAEIIERRIYLIRGEKVMLDSDLAVMYGVSTKRLNEQARRNIRRFPSDFMFQLTAEEAKSLRSQFATFKTGRGTHRKYQPHAFTEQGLAMLSGVLHSQRAIDVNVAIMRTFVKLRRILSTHKELAARLMALEKEVAHNRAEIQTVFKAIRALMEPPPKPERKIGFFPEENPEKQLR